jgi:hypothetical protein
VLTAPVLRSRSYQRLSVDLSSESSLGGGSTSPVEKVRRLEVVASVDTQSRDRSLKIMFPSGAYVSITTESELEDPLLADLLFREAGRR